jgi:hypothetical protein
MITFILELYQICMPESSQFNFTLSLSCLLYLGPEVENYANTSAENSCVQYIQKSDTQLVTALESVSLIFMSGMFIV